LLPLVPRTKVARWPFGIDTMKLFSLPADQQARLRTDVSETGSSAPDSAALSG